jgi:hypothetical protein
MSNSKTSMDTPENNTAPDTHKILQEDLFSFALVPLSAMSIKLNCDISDTDIVSGKRKRCDKLQRLLYQIECVINYTRIMHLQQFFTDSKRLMKYIDACKMSFESISIEVQKKDVYDVDLHEVYKNIFFVEDDVQYEANIVIGLKKKTLETDDNIIILELEVICTIFHCIL